VVQVEPSSERTLPYRKAWKGACFRESQEQLEGSASDRTTGYSRERLPCGACSIQTAQIPMGQRAGSSGRISGSGEIVAGGLDSENALAICARTGIQSVHALSRRLRGTAPCRRAGRGAARGARRTAPASSRANEGRSRGIGGSASTKRLRTDMVPRNQTNEKAITIHYVPGAHTHHAVAGARHGPR